MTRFRILILCLLLFAAAAGVQKVYAAGGPNRAPLAGYTVSGVRYELGATGTVTSLGFTLSPAARRVRIRLSAYGSWLPCTVAVSRVTCPLGLPARALERLTVDAT